MKIGVCLFDEPTIARSGWASIAGGKPSRINGVAEMISDVFWVTNLSYFNHRNLNLSKLPNVADEQYFRTKLSSLAQEISSSEDPEILCVLLSKVLNRTHALGKKLFDVSVDDSDYRYTSAMQNKVFGTSLRKQPFGLDALNIAEGIKQSTQENQAMTSSSFSRGSKLSTFTFSRASYAKWLLSLEYPTNSNWKKIAFTNNETIIGYEDGVKIRGTDTFIEKLNNLDEENAAIFRISVLNIDTFYLPFAKFGSGANKMVRRWATLPEIVDISRHSKISIMSGFYTKKIKLDILDKIDFSVLEHSISKGLLYENLWSAISTPIYNRDQPKVSAVGAYMRAYDRIACGRVAAAFSQHGFTVGSYGMGRVQVSIRSGEEATAREIAIANGIIPYMRFLNT